MGSHEPAAIRALIEADRVHRDIYIDPALFDLEMRRIFGRAWIYVGHESQVPDPGDYLTATIGRQPVVLVRHADGRLHVLYNRCGHRGAKVVAEGCGNAAWFRCCYHGWTFRTDGSLLSVPLRDGYRGTGFDSADPAFGMVRLARVESYRGFVFASMAAEGPTLRAYLGGAASSIDDMVDRAPDGELEVAGGCFRVLFRANWKIFVENLNDLMHPMIVHDSSIAAARNEAARAAGAGETEPLAVRIVAGNGAPYPFWEQAGIVTFENGHSHMGGIVSPRRDDPVFQDYLRALQSRHGEARAEEILAVDRHNTIFWPNASVQATFQQIRVIQPLAVDRTRMDVWSFRLKGAPEAMYRNTLIYSNVVNSPSSIVMPDDHEAYNRVQEGLRADGNEWVSLHRNAGQDRVRGDQVHAIGTSELPMRNQYRAWAAYMAAEAGA